MEKKSCRQTVFLVKIEKVVGEYHFTSSTTMRLKSKNKRVRVRARAKANANR